MITGICKLSIHIPGSSSLKDKRRVIKGIKDKLRHNFNVSVAEVDDEEFWQKAVLGIACVSNSQAHIAEVFSEAIGIIKNNGEIYILDSQIEFL